MGSEGRHLNDVALGGGGDGRCGDVLENDSDDDASAFGGSCGDKNGEDDNDAKASNVVAKVMVGTDGQNLNVIAAAEVGSNDHYNDNPNNDSDDNASLFCSSGSSENGDGCNNVTASNDVVEVEVRMDGHRLDVFGDNELQKLTTVNKQYYLTIKSLLFAITEAPSP